MNRLIDPKRIWIFLAFAFGTVLFVPFALAMPQQDQGASHCDLICQRSYPIHLPGNSS
jgi:hypothetical protein